MLIKLTGGKVYDPANKVSGEVRDIYVEDGKIVAPKPNAKADQTYDIKGRVVMAGAIDPHTHIGGGKMTIARMLLPEDHRGDPVTRTRAHPRRLRPRRALDPCHRLSLCRDGLHRLLRAGHAAGQCAPSAYGDGRHADGRQRRLRHARLRRLFPAPARGEEGFQGDQGLCRLDHACRAGDRREGGQSRRHQRLQVQSAQARSRRGARLLPRDAAADHPDARPRGAGAWHHAPAAHPWLQSRHSRQYRDRRSPRCAPRKACACT